MLGVVYAEGQGLHIKGRGAALHAGKGNNR